MAYEIELERLRSLPNSDEHERMMKLTTDAYEMIRRAKRLLEEGDVLDSES